MTDNPLQASFQAQNAGDKNFQQCLFGPTLSKNEPLGDNAEGFSHCVDGR
jgi:hypothetical protein